MSQRIAIFPGSFDPFTNGHAEIVERAQSLFDEIHIAIGYNTHKKYLFSLENRLKWIEEVYQNTPNIKVTSYEGLTADFCREINANWIVRGLRNGMDFEYEMPIARINRELSGAPETIFLSASANEASISSTIVRELIQHQQDVSKWVPKAVMEGIRQCAV